MLENWNELSFPQPRATENINKTQENIYKMTLINSPAS